MAQADEHSREQCREECVFAPYLRGNKAEQYACLSAYFNMSSLARDLEDLDPNQRQPFVDSLCFEAEARLLDPIMGSFGINLRLQRELQRLEELLYCQQLKLIQEIHNLNCYLDGFC